MRLEEKLNIIQENNNKVYQAGYELGYNEGIGVTVPSGKKFTTGTVTFIETKSQQTVTHNLGSIPSCVTMYPKDLSVIPPHGSEDAKGGAYKFACAYNLVGEISTGMTLQGNTNTGALTWQPAVGNNTFFSINETTFRTGTTSAGYKFSAGIEYEWVAIE